MAKVLVADDNAALGNVVRFHLVRAGCDVTLVQDGEAALRALRSEDVDLLVTDQQMPKMTGLEVCQQFRQEEPQAKLQVILLTAKQLELNVDELKKEFGIAHVFPKPFSPTEVIDVVQSLLCSRAK